MGGDDFDEVILKAAGVDLNGLSEGERGRVLQEAERVKFALSEGKEAVFRVPFLEGEGVEAPISRQTFERLLEPFLKRTEACCRRAMTDADLKPEEIEAVVFGGREHAGARSAAKSRANFWS